MAKKKSKSAKAASAAAAASTANSSAGANGSEGTTAADGPPSSSAPSPAISVAGDDDDGEGNGEEEESRPTSPEPTTGPGADDDDEASAEEPKAVGAEDEVPLATAATIAAAAASTVVAEAIDISTSPPTPEIDLPAPSTLPSEQAAEPVLAVQPPPPPSPAAPSHAAQQSVASTLESLPPILDVGPSTSSPRPSLDIARPSSIDLGPRDEGESEQLKALRKTLDKTKAERDRLETQYKSLVGKVGGMRETLGKKLQEDAEELDRREAQITTLTTEVATLQSTIATLQQELSSQAAETSSLSSSLSALRLQSSTTSDSALLRKREVRELQGEVERLRMEREEWEEVAGNERARAEDEELRVRELEGEVRRLMVEAGRERDKGKREEERAVNLQSVLEEFQASKESEVRSAVSELETHLRNTTASLSEWKLRASTAEARLTELKSDAGKTQTLEREVKEKNLLIGKLRHENVIMNEHLTEALRRIKKNSGDENVDRRLVTNILLSYLTTARGDSKRFEMLSLLSSILSWSDLEREQAGLQKSSAKAGSMLRRPSGIVARPIPEDDEEPANESFSQLFVEFLMKEATSGTGPSSPTPASPAPSNAGLLSPARPSFSSLGPSAQSTPTTSPRASMRALPTGDGHASQGPATPSAGGTTTPTTSAAQSEVDPASPSRPRLGSMASFGLRAVGFGGSSKSEG